MVFHGSACILVASSPPLSKKLYETLYTYNNNNNKFVLYAEDLLSQQVLFYGAAYQ